MKPLAEIGSRLEQLTEAPLSGDIPDELLALGEDVLDTG